MINGSVNGSCDVGVKEADDIPSSVAIAGAIVGIAIMSVGTFGNVLVIIAVIISKPLNKVANTFVVSLAFCDLFRTVCVMPFHIYTYARRTWTLGDRVCVYLLFASNLSILEGIVHVCTIAFYRYVIILHPRLARGLRSVRAVVIMLVFLYIVPVLITVLPALEKLSSGKDNTPSVAYITKIMFCSFTHRSHLKLVRMLRKTIFLACAALFLFYCYIRIYIAVHRSRKQLHVRGQFSPSRVEQEMTLLKTFLVVFVCFVACYMPVSIMYGLDKDQELNHQTYLIAVLLLWLSGSTNWMIYGLFNRQYLLAYKVILCGLSPRRFSRDTNATFLNGSARHAYRLRISRSLPEVLPAVAHVSESSISACGPRSENALSDT